MKTLFGYRLKKIRNNFKLSQSELAKQLRVSQRSISAWEKGETEPAMKYLFEIAHLFEIDMNYFFGLDKETFEYISNIESIICDAKMKYDNIHDIPNDGTLFPNKNITGIDDYIEWLFSFDFIALKISFITPKLIKDIYDIPPLHANR